MDTVIRNNEGGASPGAPTPRRWTPHPGRSLLQLSLTVVLVLAVGVGSGMARAADRAPAAATTTTSSAPRALWGVDSVDPITPSFLDAIGSALGAPDFFGRYLGGRYAMTTQEIDLAFSRGIRILVLDNTWGTAHETGYAMGQADAAQAIVTATALGIPRGVAIFRDVETGSDIDMAFVRGYVDALAKSPYLPGFYGNPVNGRFTSAYCGAAALGPSYAAAYVFSAVYEPGRGPRAQAPAFAPFAPPCSARTVAWQYGEPDGDAPGAYCVQTVTCPNVDTDQALPSLPFWSRTSAKGAPLLFNGGFEDGVSGWTAAGNTTLTILGSDKGRPKEGAADGAMRSTSLLGAVSQTIPVATTPGQSYTLSMWVRAPRSSRTPFKGSVVLFGLGGRTEAASADFAVGHHWTLVSVRFTPTTRHTDLQAAIYLRTKGGELRVDGGTLDAGPDPSTVQHPSSRMHPIANIREAAAG